MKRIWKNSLFVMVVLMVVAVAVWGPERLAEYRDRSILNKIEEEPVENRGEGYRYTLNSNEKLYILSMSLRNQMLPETEQSRRQRMGNDNLSYEELNGSYAFVLNKQGPAESEIDSERIYEVCNQELETLKMLGVLPREIRKIEEGAYEAQLYSAIDVLEPRNNVPVWKINLSTSQQNADKSNRLLDVYMDAQTGKLYEFYVRMEESWEDLKGEELVKKWSDYLELKGMERYESDNPLLETTPYFMKYRFPGKEQGSTVVTIGFYEGINELFIKISE